MPRLEEKLTQHAAGVLGPGELVVAAAKVAKPGYYMLSMVAIIPAMIAVVALGQALPLGVIGAAMVGGVIGGSVALGALSIGTALDRTRCDAMAARGVPIATAMVWGVTQHRLIMWRGNLLAGSATEVLGSYPLSSISRVEQTRKGTWPKVKLAIGPTDLEVEFAGAKLATTMLPALGYHQGT